MMSYMIHLHEFYHISMRGYSKHILTDISSTLDSDVDGQQWSNTTDTGAYGT